MAEARDYTNMSLDDVIKDMKARKTAQERATDDNSPFLRQNDQSSFKNRSFKPIFMRRKPYQNNATNFTRKRVQQAKRTLDLRNRIIHLRATREGLDLRWKIVANMIAKLRQQENMFKGTRYHPYGTSGPHGHPSHHGPDGLNGFSQPRVPRASLNQIERLVGKLPSWMRPKNSTQPRIHQQHYPPGPGPIRTRPHGPIPSPGMCSSYASCHPAPPHVPCPSVHSGCSTPHSHCQRAVPFVCEPPPLVFEPPPPTYRAQNVHHAHAAHNMTGGADQFADISIVVPNETAVETPIKRTLHERFSM